MRTSCCAFGPYLRREEDFFLAPERDREEVLREVDERLLRLPLERREEDFFAELRERVEPREEDFFFALDFFELLERPFFFEVMNYSP